MGGGGGGAGQAPTLNSREIGRNQARQNAQAAIASATMNNVNQITPYGSLTYKQTGGYTDENDQFIPQFTATQELTPAMQGLFNQRTTASGDLFNLGNSLLPGLRSSLTKAPLDTTGYTNEAYRALTSRSNADLDRVRLQEQSQLANQGVAPGSEAYRRGLEPVTRGYVDASTQATINAQQLADQMFNRDRMQQQDLLNNYGNVLQLAQGGQVQPNFVNTPQSQVQAADVTSPALAAFDAQNKAYQQAQQQAQSGSNALMGSLFGLGGAAAGAFLGNPMLGYSLGSGVGSLFGGSGGGASSLGGKLAFGSR